LKVSERFAQYIDKMIQESGGDSGNVDTLNQLQQFMEPMLFLSGLELANTFEHFYRCENSCYCYNLSKFLIQFYNIYYIKSFTPQSAELFYLPNSHY